MIWATVLAALLSGLRGLLSFALSHWEALVALACYAVILVPSAPLAAHAVAGAAIAVFAALYGGRHGIRL